MEPTALHRTAVLDVGSFSARLVAVDPTWSLSRPAVNDRTKLRLDRAFTSSGCLDRAGIDAIAAAVANAQSTAARHRITRAFPLATSSVRDASNAEAVVSSVAERTGVTLRFLSGRAEAELAYRACRGWFGASQGPLTLVDIGGGTLELATGNGEQAEATRSVPLGARAVSGWFSAETPPTEELADLRRQACDRAREVVGALSARCADSTAVGCSKTLRQLARLSTANRSADRRRTLRLGLEELQAWIPALARLPSAQRAELPAIAAHRARQSLGGAVVAEAVMLACSQKELLISPWSTREGLLGHLMTQAPAQLPKIVPAA